MIWKDPLNSQISVLNIVKMIMLPKSTYRFSAVRMEIPKHSSQKWKKYILKRNLPHDPVIQLISTVVLNCCYPFGGWTTLSQRSPTTICIRDICITIYNSNKIIVLWSHKKNNFMVVVNRTWWTVLKGCNIRKFENHCISLYPKDSTSCLTDACSAMFITALFPKAREIN